jgi:hypothetical protein
MPELTPRMPLMADFIWAESASAMPRTLSRAADRPMTVNDNPGVGRTAALSNGFEA